VLFLSEDEAAEGRAALEPDPARVRHLPNAIPLERFAAFDPEDKPAQATPRIALAGRLETRSKGLDLAFEALASLAEDYAFDVHLIGHEPSPEAIPPALAGRVTGTGWLDSAGVARALHEASLFIMPSRYEPFGLLALEAHAVGTPVIAMATGGLREIIVPGVTGLLAAPDNAVSDIRAGVQGLLDAPASGRALAEAALARLETHYTIPVVADRLEALYAELLGNR